MSLILHYPMNNSRLLPVEYQEVAYLEFTGTQYIDTGLKFNAEIDGYEIKALSSDITHNGMPLATNNNYTWLYFYGKAGINMYMLDSSGSQRSISGITHDLAIHILSYKNKTYYADNVNKGNVSSYSFNISTDNMAMGRYGSSYYFKGKIYYCNIYKSSLLSRQFIPCYRKSDSVAGMYDVSEPENYTKQRFYTNSGSGTFIVGPDVVSLPDDYLLVEYIQNIGGARIITGVNVTTAMAKTLKVEYLAVISTTTLSGTWRIYGYNTPDYSLGIASNNLFVTEGSGTKYSGTTDTQYVTLRMTYIADYPNAKHYLKNEAGTTIYELTRATMGDLTFYGYGYGLFQSVNSDGSGGECNCTSKLYYAKFWNSGTLIGYYIPSIQKSTGIAGMYDLVNGVFYTNSGSGLFIVGNPINGLLEFNSVGENLWPFDNTWTLSATNNRKYPLGFNGIPGPWTISFDAYASTAITAHLDICDLGSKNISITTSKLHFSITATAAAYYTPSAYNGFFDVEYSTSGTVYLSNIALYRGSHDFGYAPPKSEGLLTNVGYKYGIEGEYDKTYYTESDGSVWIRIGHHNNPASYLFSSSNDFTKPFYTDANRWWDMPKCNEVNSWELMVKLKQTSSSSEVKYRWTLPTNPYLSDYEDLNGKVIYNTSSGYSSGNGDRGYSLYNSKIYFRCQSGWWGYGSWTAYGGGYPGCGLVTVTTGYEDVYLRIDNCTPSVYKGYSYFKDYTSYLTCKTAPTTVTNGTVTFWRKGIDSSGWLLCSDTHNYYFCATDTGNTNHWSSSSGSPTMYIDGSSTAAARGLFDTDWHFYAITGVNFSSWNNLFINGFNSHSSSWNHIGYLKDFRIYDTALSANDIKELYNMYKI